MRKLIVGGLLVVCAVPLLAHEGHDHGAPPPPVTTSIAPRFDASSEAFEMVGVYRAGKLTFHLDRFRGNAPVPTARLDIETPKGVVQAKPEADGQYAVDAPWLKPGKKDLIVTVTLGSEIDVLSGQINVAPPASGLPVGAVDLAQRLPDGALFVPKDTQRILGIRNAWTVQGQHRRRVVLPGRVIPDPDASGHVQASVSGRLMPPQGGFPRLGTRVKAGQVLALVMPSMSGADLTAQAQQARELDQAIALAQRKLERYRMAGDAMPRALGEDAAIELAGLKKRRASLESVPTNPERLIAPVDGIVAAANTVAGQIMDANTVVFQIVDPARLWVEALGDTQVSDLQGASIESPGGESIKLVFRGLGQAMRQQAVPMHFALTAPAPDLRIGQLLSVHVETDKPREGIVLPRASVLRAANGLSIVFEQTNAERFMPRVVRHEALDATRVLVHAGLKPGMRIVTEGAELLNQIR